MIYYFSGTGNSRYVAEQLAKKLADKTCAITESLYRAGVEYTPAAEEAIGFVIPVYFWGLPQPVDDFLSHFHINAAERPYTYLVLTCGGSINNAARCFHKYMPLDYSNFIIMPDNFIIIYDTIPDEDIKRVLEKARTKIASVMREIRARKKLPVSAGPLAMMMTAVIYPLYHKTRRTQKFFADEKCTGCGRCAASCPVQAIRLEENRPHWVKEQCALCLACIHRCPERACQYGKSTAPRRRYTHPDLAAMEADGQ